MVWLPDAKLEVLMLAVVFPSTLLRVAWPRFVAPSKKLTTPVGLPAAVPLGLLTVSVAVSATAWPDSEGLAEETTTMLVLTLLTVWLPARAPALPAKWLSPL